MSKSFIETFKQQATRNGAYDFPAVEMTALTGSVTTLSVWACMALYESATGTPVGLDAIVVMPAVIYPVQGLLYGAVWLTGKVRDTVTVMKKAQHFAAPSVDLKDLPGRAGPRPSY
jgi:hypothetical protein